MQNLSDPRSPEVEGLNGSSPGDAESKPTTLDSFLSELAEEGASDSEGHFTIAADRALEKLARFQLPEPHYWLCKLYQAAVASQASRIEIECARKTLEVKFALPDGWTPAGIEEALLNPQKHPDERAMAHLIVGLRSAVFGSNLALYLRAHPEGGPTSGMFLVRSDFRHHSSPEEIEPGTLLMEFQSEQSVLIGAWQEEVDELVGRAVGGVELVIDGSVSAMPELDQPSRFHLPFQAGRCFLPGESQEIPAAEGSSYRLWDYHLRPDLPDPKLLFHWIIDGLVVHRNQQLPIFRLVPELLLDVSQAKTDLTGFQIEMGEREQALMRDATATVRERLETYLAEFDQRYLPNPLFAKRMKGSLIGVGAFLLFTLAGASLALGPSRPMTLDWGYYLYIISFLVVAAAPVGAIVSYRRFLGTKRKQQSERDETKRMVAAVGREMKGFAQALQQGDDVSDYFKPITYRF